jgi:anaerobic magnesium-protoporphyrin IX monomethyl ester cyclase
MKVTLVYPSNLFLKKQHLRMMGTIPHLGLLSIAGVLQREGHICDFIDGFNACEPPESTATRALEFDPDVIGITALTPNYPTAQKVAQAIRRRRKDIPIVIGGQHATNMPRQVLDSGAFDYVVTGEGEHPMRDLVKALEEGRHPGDIPGLMYRDEDGEVHHRPEEVIEDLGVLPLRAWNLVDLKKYLPSPASYRRRPAISTMMQRGCPKACTFCSVNSMFKYNTRQHTYEFLEQELIIFKRQGITDVNFWDSVFSFDREWTIGACEILKKHGFIWNCIGRMDHVDRELLQIMKDSGCYEIGYGVESGVQTTLDRMQKQQKLPDVERTIKLTKEVGIKAKCFFLVGFPWETMEDVQTTFDFAWKLRPEIAAFSIVTPYPGSRWWEQYEHRFTSTSAYEGMDNLSGSVSISDHISTEELKRATERMRNRYYLSPSYLRTSLRHIHSWEDMKYYAKSFWEIFVVP